MLLTSPSQGRTQLPIRVLVPPHLGIKRSWQLSWSSWCSSSCSVAVATATRVAVADRRARPVRRWRPPPPHL